MKLVASMIVRNELGRYLDLAIEHLLTYVDEIRVLDDGSDDGTFEWLEKQEGVLVVRNEGASFYEYESAARNKLLAWTYEADPSYVLSIDADEFVGDPSLLLSAMRSGQFAYTLQMEEVWGASEEGLSVRVDGHWGARPCPILWHAPHALDRGFPAWKVMDRKLACGREPMAVRKLRSRPTRSSVFHFGWANRSERETRAERYFEHDKGRFHADRHLQSILWDDTRVITRQKPWPSGLSDLAASLASRAAAPRP